ncbi:unnamed protein product [Clonostachys rosea]|uniref:DUF676 domain-containing protein n=1 Tax=Bionectria ochroleuca TaxID=29856 RepID=A0ABY6UK27_BIOOC|nr:unnamed protein product [Clonostachys rosea]
MRKFFRLETKRELAGPSLSRPMRATSREEPFPSGIKQLYGSPETSDTYIVFVHGLDGNREKTWTAKGAAEPWPKAILPLELPSARILTLDTMRTQQNGRRGALGIEFGITHGTS